MRVTVPAPIPGVADSTLTAHNMSDSIIRLQDCPPRPWENGLGRTRELAVQPSVIGSADWLWRISVAEVDSAAPFSAFPGVERTIVLLAGAGFRMTLDGGHVHALTTPFVPFTFPGEVRVDVELADGATRDFNVMARRALATTQLQVRRTPGTYTTDAATVLVYCALGRTDTPAGVLRADEAWRPARARASAFTLHTDSVALVVRVEGRGS